MMDILPMYPCLIYTQIEIEWIDLSYRQKGAEGGRKTEMPVYKTALNLS